MLLSTKSLLSTLPLWFLVLEAAGALTIESRKNGGTSQSGSSSTNTQIFLDFDGTIAVSDAYYTLAYAAEESIPANSSAPSWDYVEEVYGKVYEAAASTLPTATNLSGEIALSNNDVMRAVEQWSFTWVSGLGIFDTARASNLRDYARNVTLRDGWCGFVEQAQNRGIHINVVSLNWSPSWLRLVMQEASDCPKLVQDISIYCAEILPKGVLPYNKLDKAVGLFSGGDKTDLINKILAKIPEREKERVVFVSDGDADLEPLWRAPTNVGVVAGNSSVSSAPEAFEKYNVSIVPASGGFRGYSGEASGSSFIYSLESWDDLQQLLWN